MGAGRNGGGDAQPERQPQPERERVAECERVAFSVAVGAFVLSLAQPVGIKRIAERKRIGKPYRIALGHGK